MEGILREMGATDEDFDGLKAVSNNLGADPTLPFRESRNGRFELNFLTSKINRIEFQPFVLSAQEDFVRHDSGKVRGFCSCLQQFLVRAQVLNQPADPLRTSCQQRLFALNFVVATPPPSVS
ncbi:2OG-Fe dioxygenase family protein [Erwinia sp. S43]|nr:2OG-Fe dioxygenase family protein [Erwinia sp. S43]